VDISTENITHCSFSQSSWEGAFMATLMGL
jgi:hypothetical protein